MKNLKPNLVFALLFAGSQSWAGNMGSFFGDLMRLFPSARKEKPTLSDKEFVERFKEDLWDAVSIYGGGQEFVSPIQPSNRKKGDPLVRTSMLLNDVKLCPEVPNADAFNSGNRTAKNVYIFGLMSCLAPRESSVYWAKNKSFSSRDTKASARNRSKTVGGIYSIDMRMEHGGNSHCVANWNGNKKIRGPRGLIQNDNDLAAELESPNSQRYAIMCGVEKLLYNLRYQQMIAENKAQSKNKTVCVSPFSGAGDKNLFGPLVRRNPEVVACMKTLLKKEGLASRESFINQIQSQLLADKPEAPATDKASHGQNI